MPDTARAPCGAQVEDEVVFPAGLSQALRCCFWSALIPPRVTAQRKGAEFVSGDWLEIKRHEQHKARPPALCCPR